jgi:hypothetical protein
MFQRIGLVSIAAGLVFLSLFIVGLYGYVTRPTWLTQEQVEKEAKKRLGEPALPTSPPSGTKATTISQRVCSQVPEYGPPVSASPFPTVRMRDECKDIRIPSVQVVAPTTEELVAYERAVQAATNAYYLRLQGEISKINGNQRAEMNQFIFDLIKIAAGILGLVGTAGGVLITANSSKGK